MVFYVFWPWPFLQVCMTVFSFMWEVCAVRPAACGLLKQSMANALCLIYAKNLCIFAVFQPTKVKSLYLHGTFCNRWQMCMFEGGIMFPWGGRGTGLEIAAAVGSWGPCHHERCCSNQGPSGGNTEPRTLQKKGEEKERYDARPLSLPFSLDIWKSKDFLSLGFCLLSYFLFLSVSFFLFLTFFLLSLSVCHFFFLSFFLFLFCQISSFLYLFNFLCQWNNSCW